MAPSHPLIGQKAPPVTLPDAEGNPFTLSPGTSGRPTAVFFYPQAGTYGCTKEACSFRDALQDLTEYFSHISHIDLPVFKDSNVEVVGISADPVAKQKKFSDDQKLTYTILSDEKGEAKNTYKVGKGLMGLIPASRTTFVIDKDGTVKDVLDSTLGYNKHSKFVADWLKKLGEGPKSGNKIALPEPPTAPEISVTEPTPTAGAAAPAPVPPPALTTT